MGLANIVLQFIYKLYDMILIRVTVEDKWKVKRVEDNKMICTTI